MNLANICIHRPVFTVMLMAALVVLGLFSYTGLGLDLYPKIDFPVVSIAATLPGAGPEEIETQLAKPIEEAISTLGGIDIMTTSCVFGMCRIVVRFDLEKNIDVAAQEVRDRVARILKTLPEGTESPIIEKMDPDASPVITVVLSSPMPLRELTYFARKQIKEPLEAIEGVGAIQVVGGREREIHAILDAKKLAAFQTSVTQVRDALKGQNIDIPGGNITNGPNESILRTLGRIQTPEEFGDVIVQVQNGIPLRLKDLGTIIDHEEEARTTARLNGKTALALVVQKKSGTNTVQVIDTIKQRLKDLSKEFPQGLTYAIIRDQSQFIKASLHELNLHLVLGAILASAVVYLFMQNLVSTLISALAIPISLISTFLLMRLMGFTLNNMSMLGLTLAVGIVIDDAIVVLENVYRHMEEKGSDAMTAASEATSEISLAVLATSLSLAVIFVPVAFMQGIIGRFLNNFGLTIAFSILISIFVSFTLTPMMCSRLFRYRFARGSGHSKESAFYRVIDRVYGRLLRFSLDHRWVIILLCILSLVALKPMGAFIRSDFVPVDDTGE
ncbi:MAG TPA: efflux RND transporter permease subunit, partial [Candidatus Ozemobacteraceae bacterium]|nr:efflux RND transporter permease subunit [Candidatus Ozemobacteraceae bacterium]